VVESEYRQVSVKSGLIKVVEDFIKIDRTYSSVSAFVAEAIRLRVENLKSQGA
jgi:hypothetical protein